MLLVDITGADQLQAQQQLPIGQSTEQIMQALRELVLQAQQTAKRLTFGSTSITRFVNQSVVVTPDDLVKLDNSFRTFGEEPSYEIECVDNVTRRFSSVQELINFENPPSKDIIKLRIKSEDAAISFENSPYIFLEPQSKTGYNNIWISIEGDEEKIIKLQRDFDDRLVAMKPLYSIISGMEPLLVAILVAAIAFIPFVIKFVNAQPKLPSGQVDLSGWSGLLLIAVVLMIGVGTFLVAHFKVKLFPLAVFAVGQGAKRHSSRDFIRTIVLLAFLINVAASLYITFLLSP